MYKVVRAFYDSTDKNNLYKVGDIYPADGVKTTKKRIDELANGTNRNGNVYIEEVNADDTEVSLPQNADVNADNDADDNDASQDSE